MKLMLILALATTVFTTFAQANEEHAAEPAATEKSAPKAAGHGASHSDSHKYDPATFFPTKQADKTHTTRPAVPTLVDPKPLTTLSGATAKLTWKAVETADAYHLQVATDPNFKWLIKNENMLKATEADVTDLESGKYYYWRVAAIKSDNDPSWIKSDFTRSSFDVK